MNDTVKARIDPEIKKAAQAVLDKIGLTTSDAFRLMMVRIATEKRLPFEPLVPNATTIEAMREARAGGLERFGNVDEMLAAFDVEEEEETAPIAARRTSRADASSGTRRAARR